MASEKDEKRRENQRKRMRQNQSSKVASSHNPSGQAVGPQSIEVSSPYPCKTGEQFYDDVTGLCGMCEDICRPQHMDISQCQVKCPKFYRERMGGGSNPTTTVKAALAAGTSFLLTNTPHYRSSQPFKRDSSATDREHESSYLVQGGGAQDDSGHFITVLAITMVTSLAVILLVVLAVGALIWCRRKGRKLSFAGSSECTSHGRTVSSSSTKTSSSCSDPAHNVSSGVPELARQASNEKESHATLLARSLKAGQHEPGPSKISPPPSYTRSQSRDDKGRTMTSTGPGDCVIQMGTMELEEGVALPRSSLCAENSLDPH